MAVKKKEGRPTKYLPAFNKMAKKLCILGATNAQLADFFEVNVDSIKEWMNKYPKFSASIRSGRVYADTNVAESLYKRALGYKHKHDVIFNNGGKILTARTTKHFPPDVTAAMFWLRNRQPDKWREKQQLELSGKIDSSPVIFKLPDGTIIDM